MEWYTLALISAFFSATSAILEKKILFKEKALEFSALLAIFNMVLALPFLLVVDFSKIALLNLGVLFFKSILGAFAFLCVMKGIKNLEISGALPLLVLTPGIVAFFDFTLLNTTLKKYEIIGMILLLIGTYILHLKQKQKISDPFKIFIKSKGHIYIVYALAIFTITSLLDKILLKKYDMAPESFMAFQHIFLAIIFLIIANKRIKNLKNTFENSGSLLLILSIFTIIYRYTQILAVKSADSVALVLSIKRISVFFATVIGGRIFKEHDLLRKSIATFIMITGTVLVIVF